MIGVIIDSTKVPPESGWLMPPWSGQKVGEEGRERLGLGLFPQRNCTTQRNARVGSTK